MRGRSNNKTPVIWLFITVALLIAVGVRPGAQACAAELFETEEDDLWETTDAYEMYESVEEIPGLAAGVTEKSTEAETETETETLPQYDHWVVHIERVTVQQETRCYDGTDKADLQWVSRCEYVFKDRAETISAEEVNANDILQGPFREGLPDGRVPEDVVTVTAKLDGVNVGRHPVSCAFTLNPVLPKDTELIVEETPLYMTIEPAKLKIVLPDGWKYYGAPAKLDEITLEGDLNVSGFIRDEQGEEIIPEGYTAPELTLSDEVTAYTLQYKHNKDHVVKGGLTLLRHKDGSLQAETGSENYVFDEDTVTGGDIRIRSSEILQGEDFELSGGMDTGDVYWVGGGRRPDIRITDDKLYNQVIWLSNHRIRLVCKLDGEIRAASQPADIAWQTDTLPPSFSLTVRGADDRNGMWRSSSTVQVILDSAADDESGVSYTQALLQRSTGEVIFSGSFEHGRQMTISREGIYTLSAYAEDAVGNRYTWATETFEIDHTSPIIEINGIEDGADTAQQIRLRITVSDSSLDEAQTTAQLISIGTGGEWVTGGQVQKVSGGALITFPKLGSRRNDDGRYTLTVQAEDLSGNRSFETMSFTLNSTGPVYRLSPESRGFLSSYWHRTPEDLVISAEDYSDIYEVQAVCRRGHETYLLQEGSGVSVSRTETSEGKTRADIRITSAYFTKNGEYDVVLLARDRTGHQVNSTGVLSLQFAIDNTPPEGLITGVRSGQMYEAEKLTAGIHVRDNLVLGGMRLYVNNTKTVEMSGAQLQEAEGFVRFELGKNECWQTITAYLYDQAGNGYWTEPVRLFVGDPSMVKFATAKRQNLTGLTSQADAEVSSENAAKAQTSIETSAEKQTEVITENKSEIVTEISAENMNESVSEEAAENATESRIDQPATDQMKERETAAETEEISDDYAADCGNAITCLALIVCAAILLLGVIYMWKVTVME